MYIVLIVLNSTDGNIQIVPFMLLFSRYQKHLPYNYNMLVWWNKSSKAKQLKSNQNHVAM